jgi:transcriptional regulator with XRE-family HTH domain
VTVSDDTLGEFLRSRRERISPVDVGLPDHGRRRTPGLRREEVAALAGVSVDYLVRLEQGRDTNPSTSVLTSLASALRLSRDERRHMAKLAAWASTGEVCAASEDHAATEVEPSVQRLLDAMADVPAFVVGPFGDVLAWNQRWERLVAPMGLVDGSPPNLARYALTDPRAHDAYPDWERAADEAVGRLRSSSALWREDPNLRELLQDLSEVPAFATRWAAHEVAEKHPGPKTLRHPEVGELRIELEVLWIEDADQQLVTWLPHDDATAEAMRRAVGDGVPVSPAHLRVVGDEARGA